MRLHRTTLQPDERSDQPVQVHAVDEVLPAHQLAVLGLQHLFIMYAGAVAVPLIVGGALKLPPATIGLLVSADLLVSGIATIIPGHLRIQHHLGGDRGVRAEPRVQPLELAAAAAGNRDEPNPARRPDTGTEP